MFQSFDDLLSPTNKFVTLIFFIYIHHKPSLGTVKKCTSNCWVSIAIKVPVKNLKFHVSKVKILIITEMSQQISPVFRLNAWPPSLMFLFVPDSKSNWLGNPSISTFKWQRDPFTYRMSFTCLGVGHRQTLDGSSSHCGRLSSLLCLLCTLTATRVHFEPIKSH